jgi:hypothetical protein
MGLLDDAIREHLELKRLRGADPSQVIHEEREAFGPVLPDGDPVPTGSVVDSGMRSTAREGHAFDRAEARSAPDLSRLSQETVELDMRAVLETGSIEGSGHVEPVPLTPMMTRVPGP